jgi:hypothetical protein
MRDLKEGEEGKGGEVRRSEEDRGGREVVGNPRKEELLRLRAGRRGGGDGRERILKNFGPYSLLYFLWVHAKFYFLAV